MCIAAWAAIIGALLLVGVSSCGCAQYSQACGTVLEYEVALQGKLADAQRARQELDKSGIREALPPAQQLQYDQALALIDKGYADAVATMAVVHDACTVTDVRGALQAIVCGWKNIAPLLSLIGGEGTPNVLPPALYLEAQ